MVYSCVAVFLYFKKASFLFSFLTHKQDSSQSRQNAKYRAVRRLSEQADKHKVIWEKCYIIVVHRLNCSDRFHLSAFTNKIFPSTQSRENLRGLQEKKSESATTYIFLHSFDTRCYRAFKITGFFLLYLTEGRSNRYCITFLSAIFSRPILWAILGYSAELPHSFLSFQGGVSSLSIYPLIHSPP